MPRWENELYRDDEALDYLSAITDKLAREFAYWFSPEQVTNESWWLASVLTVIELALLFEDHDPRSSVFLTEVKAVQRWRETFLNIWDEEKDSTELSAASYLVSNTEYRKLHRQAVVVMFDRLESIAHYWAVMNNIYDQPELVPLLPDYPLPYFSLRQFTRFKRDLIEQIVKDIIYYTSGERRPEVVPYGILEAWVAVDVLGVLCNAYAYSPGINEESVRSWRDTLIYMWKTHIGVETWDETDGLYRDMMVAFNQLEAVARKYPPGGW